MVSWSYIAGFFDGEGSITHNGKGYRITITQTNLQVLQGIRQFTKIGNVIALARRQPHWKDNWAYYIAKQADVYRFLKGVTPHLIVKQNLTQRTLRALPELLARQKERAKRAKWHKIQAHILRQRGLSYRAIGQQLGIDWGYARRLYLESKNTVE